MRRRFVASCTTKLAVQKTHLIPSGVGHVPVSVVMVWFTNPLTYAPLFYAAWQSGSMILGKPVLAEPLNFSTQSLLHGVGHAWPTVLTGMLFCASVSAVVGFGVTLLAWRIHAVRRWRQRRSRKRNPA